MFWKKKPKTEPRKYTHICYTCEREFVIEQRLDHCPECKEKLIEEAYEYIHRIKGVGRRYYHVCDDCKVHFDTRDEDVGMPCIRCQKPSTGYGYALLCGDGRPFIFRLGSWLSQFFPSRT